MKYSIETFFERQHSTKMPQHRINRHTHNTPPGQVLNLSPFTFAQRSIACERHPTRNEDSILIDELGGIAAVFDGVGGSAAGEIASQTAAQATRQGWLQVLYQQQQKRRVHTLLEDRTTLNLHDILQNLILEADERVRTDGAQRAGTDDLATTVALAVFSRQPGTRNFTMVHAHVGDSRIYLLRGQERLQRLTSDDGLLAKLVENQVINEFEALRIDQAMTAQQLSEIEFSYFRLRGGITQALGGPLPPTIHIDQITIHPEDRILLCTDGIHDNLTDEEIEEILRNSHRAATARTLIEHSLQRSHQDRSTTIRAKPDDMSAIVITCRI